MEEIRRFTASNISWILIGNFLNLSPRLLNKPFKFHVSGNKCDMDSLREVEQVEALALVLVST